MSVYVLVFIMGILAGAVVLVVIFSLLITAKRGDAYLEKMSLVEAAGLRQTLPAKSQEVHAANPFPEDACRDGQVVSRTS